MTSFFLGILTALGFPPVHAWPLFSLGLTGLLCFLESQYTLPEERRRIGTLLWFWCWGVAGVGFSWVCWALTVDTARFWPLMPIVLIGLPAFLALLTWPFLRIAALLGRPGVNLWMALALALSFAEVSRSINACFALLILPFFIRVGPGFSLQTPFFQNLEKQIWTFIATGTILARSLGPWKGPFFLIYNVMSPLLGPYERDRISLFPARMSYIGLFFGLLTLPFALMNPLGGFPWNLTATLWTPWPVMLQTASFWGSHGLSLVTLLWLSAPYLLIRALLNPQVSLSPAENASKPFLSPLIQRALGVWLVATLGAVLWTLGHLRMGPVQPVSGITLRLLQPNLCQKQKFHGGHEYDHLRTLVALSRAPSQTPITHIIWPEACLPFRLGPAHTQGRFPMFFPMHAGQHLFLGGVREGPGGQLYNSLCAINDHGTIVGIYDKVHLVPFGEYVPFRKALNFLFGKSALAQRFFLGLKDIQRGPKNQTLHPSGMPALACCICYDSIFPGDVAHRGDRPGWILDLTNNAWFGRSAGVYQHFAAARLRAVEEGLPLVRATNTGITAVLDPYGRISAHLPAFEQGVLDTALPQALPPTPFTRLGRFAWALMALALAFLIGLRRKPDPEKALPGGKTSDPV